MGWAIRGLRATAAIWPITRSIRIGPVEQLAPMTAAPPSSSARNTSMGVAPPLGATVLLEAHLGDDGQVAGLPRRPERLQHLVEILEGFEHNQVHPAVEQAIDLFAEDGPRLRQRDAAQRLHRHAERPHRAGDKHRHAGDLAGMLGQLGGPRALTARTFSPRS